MLSRSSVSATPEVLDEFYLQLVGFSLAPLWQVQETAVVSEPTSKAVPYIWRWKNLEPQALLAGKLIGTQDAERGP